MSHGVGHRCSSDLALLWLWHRLAAVAPIRLLAWEPPYAADVALKRQKKKKKKKKNEWGISMVEKISHSRSVISRSELIARGAVTG